MDPDVLDRLRKAILTYEPETALAAVKEALDSGVNPVAALDAMTGAIREVGEAFGRGDLFLPELMGAAAAMKTAMPVLEAELQRRDMERQARGTVVIGTVRGDVHDIGKSMVATLLTANGFVVHDLGVDLPAETFVEGARRHRADIVAMSALLTTTVVHMKGVVEALAKEGLGVRTMVGGAAVTDKFAEEIGADGYDATATGAVTLALRLIAEMRAEDPK